MRRFLQMMDIAPPLEQAERSVRRDIFGSSQGSTSTNTISKSDPWEGVQPYMRDIFARGQGLSNINSPSWATQQAQTMGATRALAGSPQTGAAQGQNLATLQGNYLNADPANLGATARGDYTDLSKNPAAQSAMDMAKTRINSQFSGDNFGNSAHQEWLGKGLMEAASPFYESERNRQFGAQGLLNQNFGAERGRQMQASTLAPTLANQDYADIGQLGSIGGQLDAQPWNNLFNYQRAIAGSGATGGTSNTTSEQPYFTNPTANALGTATSAAMLWNLLSDRRFKRDIKKLADVNGYGLYRFKYLSSDVEHVGVMADEVEKVNPAAVSKIAGISVVNYGAL